MSKEDFKNFARLHPSLASQVNSNNTTWQKLYELYDIYGENSSVWDNYFKNTTVPSITNNSTVYENKNLKDVTISDFMNTIKNIDLETVQKGINNIQKTIGLLQDMGLGNSKNVTPSYEPRPMYKYFED